MAEQYESIFLDKSNPEAFKALAGVRKQVTQALSDAGIGNDIVELCNLRASQINGCHYCINMHAEGARKAGVPQQLMDLLPAWRGSDLFTTEQQAALEIVEAATELPAEETRLEVIESARAVFTDEAVAALEWAAILINAYNRVSILSNHPVKERKEL